MRFARRRTRAARAAFCIPTRCRSASTLVCLSLPWRCLDVSIEATVAYVAALAAAFAAAALAPLVPSARALAATATFGYTRARVSRCPPRRMPSSAPFRLAPWCVGWVSPSFTGRAGCAEAVWYCVGAHSFTLCACLSARVRTHLRPLTALPYLVEGDAVAEWGCLCAQGTGVVTWLYVGITM